MKLDLDYDTIIRARTACKVMQHHVGGDESEIRAYERAYVALVEAHAKAIKEEAFPTVNAEHIRLAMYGEDFDGSSR